MIFDIKYPRPDNPVQAVTLIEFPGSYFANDLMDLLWDCGFGRMRPYHLHYDGFENAVELSTDPKDYIAAQEGA